MASLKHQRNTRRSARTIPFLSNTRTNPSWRRPRRNVEKASQTRIEGSDQPLATVARRTPQMRQTPPLIKAIKTSARAYECRSTKTSSSMLTLKNESSPLSTGLGQSTT